MILAACRSTAPSTSTVGCRFDSDVGTSIARVPKPGRYVLRATFTSDNKPYGTETVFDATPTNFNVSVHVALPRTPQRDGESYTLDSGRSHEDFAAVMPVVRKRAAPAVMRLPDPPGYHRVRTPHVTETDAARPFVDRSSQGGGYQGSEDPGAMSSAMGATRAPRISAATRSLSSRNDE
jgi:hypothetical protein